MSIPQSVRDEIYHRAGGQCECKMSYCSHHRAGERCPHQLAYGSWEAHHVDENKPAIASNLIAMCATCHKNTPSYGAH